MNAQDTGNPPTAHSGAMRLMIGVVGLATFGLLLYLLLVLIAYFFHDGLFKDFYEAVKGQNVLTIGLPCAAGASVAIVGVMMACFPGDRTNVQGYTVKFASLDFSGPSGPITLWLLVFGAIMLSVGELRDKPKPLGEPEPAASAVQHP